MTAFCDFIFDPKADGLFVDKCVAHTVKLRVVLQLGMMTSSSQMVKESCFKENVEPFVS